MLHEQIVQGEKGPNTLSMELSLRDQERLSNLRFLADFPRLTHLHLHACCQVESAGRSD